VLNLLYNPILNSGKIDQYCLLFLIVAVGAGLTNFLYTFSFGVAGERLVFKLRVNSFEKLIRFPISYYDRPENTPGAISSKLAADAYQVNNMITGVVGVICLNISTIGASLGIGLYYSWKLTLIMLTVSPLLILASAINVKVIKELGLKSQGS